MIVFFLLPSGLYRRYRILTGSACARRLTDHYRITAGREFHPALKITMDNCIIYSLIVNEDPIPGRYRRD